MSLRSKLISQAVHMNLTNLTYIFKNETPHVHVIAEILDILEIPSVNKIHLYVPPVQVIINFTQATVNYFFICCNEDGSQIFQLLESGNIKTVCF